MTFYQSIHSCISINVMIELIDVVHQNAESGLSPIKAKDILWFLASD